MKEIWRRLKKSKTAMFGLVVLSIFIFSAVFAEFITPYNTAIKQNIRQRMQGPSTDHWFGTDGFGRDVFARVLHGSRRSLSIGFLATLASLSVGLLFGAAVGYYGGKFDAIVMRFMDILSAIPATLMALAIVAALGSNMTNLIIAIAIARIPAFVRIIRAAILGVVDLEYIEAAKAGGAGDLRIIIKHILPNIIGTLIVQTTMTTAQLIMRSASLSFLGLGIQAPEPEWGSLLSEAREFLRPAPYLMVFPGLAIVLSTLSLNLLGDGLRDALDPRLKS
ncbi:ABC transporter permease [Pelotomaculum propionicicum]|uniref:ABC transporter permease n=1 Tax=Pelotomaculum propionicicum TaxID=258475 RepID=UPI003B9E7905